jgi:hypothetical protein
MTWIYVILYILFGLITFFTAYILCIKQSTECVDENLVPFDKVCEYLDEYLWNANDDKGDPIVESVCNITKEKFIKDLKWFIEYNHGKS